jgi:hypothetical protein
MVVAAAHNMLGMLIFVGCVGMKSEHGPQLHHTEGQLVPCKCTLSPRISCANLIWMLCWVVPCEMQVAWLVQILSSLNAEHANSSIVR